MNEALLNDEQLEQVIHGIDGMPLSALWHATQNSERDASYIPLTFQGFSNRSVLFLWVLERLLTDGRIKLHKDGVFLNGSIEDQVEMFRKAWPASERPYPSHPNAGFDLWFFDPECPAGVAWRMPDGSYQIAD